MLFNETHCFHCIQCLVKFFSEMKRRWASSFSYWREGLVKVELHLIVFETSDFIFKYPLKLALSCGDMCWLLRSGLALG